jgi:hypothetical protein
MASWIKGLNLKSTSEKEVELNKRSFWQTVFERSRANNAPYDGEQLPANPWSWPKFTAFQQRLQFIRRQRQWERE